MPCWQALILISASKCENGRLFQVGGEGAWFSGAV